MDFSSCMDMLMSMLGDLSNKVSELEQATERSAVLAPVLSAVTLHDL